MVTSTTLGRVGLEPRGEYDPSAQYTYLNIVRYEGSSYLVLRPVQGVAPVEGEDYMLLAKAGDPGAPGEPGADGTGDMSKSVYDQHGKNTDIFDYVDDALQDIPAAENAVTIEGGGTMVPPAGLGPGPYTMILDDEDGGGDDPGGESPPVPAADVSYDSASSGLEAETVQAAIDELSARDDSNPIGTVISFLGLTAPEGYLVCDGAAYSIADYPALSAFIAAQFGTVNHFGGDGTVTFAVPDLRNLFLRGYHGTAEEQLSGDIGARQEGTVIPRISSYAKKSDISNANIAFPIVESNVYGTSDLINPDKRFGISNKTVLMKGQTDIFTGNDDSYCEAYIPRPVNIAILYCIKAKTRT